MLTRNCFSRAYNFFRPTACSMCQNLQNSPSSEDSCLLTLCTTLINITLFGGRWQKTLWLFCYLTKRLQIRQMKRRMGKNSSTKAILQRILIAGNNDCHPTGNCTWRTPGRMMNGNNSAGGSVRNWDQFWAIRDFENAIIKMSSTWLQMVFITLMMITSKMRLARGQQK